jgi:molecular chaperone GrpE
MTDKESNPAKETLQTAGEGGPQPEIREPTVEPSAQAPAPAEQASEGQPPAGASTAPAGDSPEADEHHKSRKLKKGGKKSAEEEAVEMRLLRLQADFDNFRKRTLREKNDLYTRANEDLMQELLPVVDHMELALAAAREHQAPQALLDGFGLVLEQLLSALKKFNLSVINAEEGDFDPNLHEAISHLSSPTVKEGGIMAQVRRGYRLGEQLLRPAQVVVSSGSPEQAAGSC